MVTRRVTVTLSEELRVVLGRLIVKVDVEKELLHVPPVMKYSKVADGSGGDKPILKLTSSPGQ